MNNHCTNQDQRTQLDVNLYFFHDFNAIFDIFQISNIQVTYLRLIQICGPRYSMIFYVLFGNIGIYDIGKFTYVVFMIGKFTYVVFMIRKFTYVVSMIGKFTHVLSII